MWGSTCILRKVYQVLYPLKRHFGCAQAQQFLICCWLLMALIRDPGKGPLKGLKPYLPATPNYWTTMRLLRSGQWDAAAGVCDLATATLRGLPPPADGVLYLIGDSTVKEKRGRKHPVGCTTRHSEHAPYPFGCEVVLLIARWGRLRVPVALVLIAPKIKGHQHPLFRQMLKDFVPPAWVRQIIVIADAGFAANATMRLITDKPYGYVFAMPRPRKFTNGKHLRDLVQHWPKSCYDRRASAKPDGRRQAYWVFVRQAKHGAETDQNSRDQSHGGTRGYHPQYLRATVGCGTHNKGAQERSAPGSDASDERQGTCDTLGGTVRSGLSSAGPFVRL